MEKHIQLTTMANNLKDDLANANKEKYSLEYIRIFPVVNLVLKQDLKKRKPDIGLLVNWKYKDELRQISLKLSLLAPVTLLAESYNKTKDIPKEFFSISQKNKLPIPKYLTSGEKSFIDFISSLIREKKVKSLL